MRTKEDINLTQCEKCGKFKPRGTLEHHDQSGQSWCYGCFKDEEEGKKDNKPDYEKAYNILAEYWDSLPDAEKEYIDQRLKRCGL